MKLFIAGAGELFMEGAIFLHKLYKTPAETGFSRLKFVSWHTPQ